MILEIPGQRWRLRHHDAQNDASGGHRCGGIPASHSAQCTHDTRHHDQDERTRYQRQWKVRPPGVALIVKADEPPVTGTPMGESAPIAPAQLSTNANRYPAGTAIVTV